jgi:Na+-driven multidrug efflux pump
MITLGPGLYGSMGAEGNALAIAVSYSSIIFAGATLIWMFNLLMAVVRGTGNLQVPVIVVCSGALILVPLSPALIFGAFGYHGLGASGGAVAMLVFYAFGTLAYAAWCRNSRLRRCSRFSVSAQCRPWSRPAPTSRSRSSRPMWE